MKKTFELIQVLDNLSRIPRSGGATFSGINPIMGETVAEHSFKVSWLALIFAGRLKKKGQKINEAKLLNAAITHDWSEAVLLDIPSGSPSYQSYFEKINLREVVKKAEQKTADTFDQHIEKEVELDLSDFHLNGKETALLKAADLAAILLEILNWQAHGMRFAWFKYIWANKYAELEKIITKDLPELGEILNEFKTSHIRGEKPINPFLTKPEFQKLKKKVKKITANS